MNSLGLLTKGVCERMDGDRNSVQYSLCSRGVLVRLQSLEEVRNGTIGGIGRGWARTGSRRRTSINGRWVLMHGYQHNWQKGIEISGRTAIMPSRTRLIFSSLEIFQVRDSIVSPLGPLSAFCFASQAQFEGDNWTLLYSVEPSTSEMIAARIASYRSVEWGERKDKHKGRKKTLLITKPRTLLASTLDMAESLSTMAK